MTEATTSLVQEPVQEPAEQKAKPIWADFKLKPLDVLKDGIVPYSFQEFSVYKSLMQGRFIFGLATGLGKTLCSYLTYQYFLTKYPTTRMIIVTTNSAVLQFRNEYGKFFKDDRRIVAIERGMPRFGGKTYANARKNAYSFFASPHDLHKIDVLVLNYAVFRIDHAAIMEAIKSLTAQKIPFFFITDEATAFKNVSTVTFKAINSVSKYASKALALTATLTKGKLEEIYGIFKGIGIQLTANKDEFYERFCITFAHPSRPHIKNVVGYKNVAEFIELVRPYCIVLRKADVAEFLPPYVITKKYIEHDEDQFALIRDIYSGVVNPSNFGSLADDTAELNLADAEVVDPSKVFDAQEEQQNMGGVQIIQKLTEVGFIKRALMDHRLVIKKDLGQYKKHSPKTSELLQMLKDECTNEKVVVYTPSLQYLKLLLGSVREDDELEPYYKNALEISGRVTGAKRENSKTLFQEQDTHNLIMINDAGLEAINLQAASILVVMSLPKSGGDLVQLAGRLSRLGSTHKSLQIIYMMIKDSQDEDEYDILQRQMQIMSTILGEAEIGLLDWDRLKEIDKVEEGISEEEYQAKSLVRLMLVKRKKRESFYREPQNNPGR